MERRVVVPAAWFYEWNKSKEKNIFYRKGQPEEAAEQIKDHIRDFADKGIE